MLVLTFAVDLKTKNQDTVFNRLRMKVNITCPTVLFLWCSHRETMPLSHIFWSKVLNNFKKAKDDVCLEFQINEKR